jgi:hypothetical protein
MLTFSSREMFVDAVVASIDLPRIEPIDIAIQK